MPGAIDEALQPARPIDASARVDGRRFDWCRHLGVDRRRQSANADLLRVADR